MLVCSNDREKKYKELELTKLEFHITRNSSLGSSSTIEEEKKRAIRSSFVFTKNSSLVSSSIVLHGTRVFKTWFTKQTRVSWTQVSEKWYTSTYFANSGMFLRISVKSGKWLIWPWSTSNNWRAVNFHTTLFYTATTWAMFIRIWCSRRRC